MAVLSPQVPPYGQFYWLHNEWYIPLLEGPASRSGRRLCAPFRSRARFRRRYKYKDDSRYSK